MTQSPWGTLYSFWLIRRNRTGSGILAAAVLVGGLGHVVLACGAERLGPELPAWTALSSAPSLRTPPLESIRLDLLERLRIQEYLPTPPPTLERVSGETKGPRIPEPMVFDLVRPLGERRGAGEVNVLGLVPLRRTSKTVDQAPDPLGLVRRSSDTQGMEWAPEIEYTVADGFAIELEAPMENASLEAYKAAGQLTFGTGFDHRFIHGAQVIAQYDRDPGLWTTSWLYLAGYRFDQIWSLFAMAGPRFEHGGQIGGRHTEMLTNATLFADVSDRLVAGIEVNHAQVINGHRALLVMPQAHYELGTHWMLQAGVGARFTQDLAIPQIGFRLIREF